MVDGVGTTHHVKLGDFHHLVRPGTYRKMGAPLFGSRFTTGDPDYNNLSFWQHWVQSCWIGGFGAETWEDDAMFDEAVGVDTSQHEVMVLSRDLGPSTDRNATGNWDLEGAVLGRKFLVAWDKLYCLTHGDRGSGGTGPHSRLFMWNTATSTWDQVYDSPATRVRGMVFFANYILLGDEGTTLTRLDSSHTASTFDKPGATGGTDDPEDHVPYVFKVYRGQLYTAFGPYVWRMNSDFTWDGSTHFYHAQDISSSTSYINLMEVHQGFLWMVSQSGVVLRTDGNNTFNMWQFPDNLGINGIRSFDGKLWISGGDRLDGLSATEGVLYSFTGSAVTEVKRWGKVGQIGQAGPLSVVGRRLMLGGASQAGMGDGFGILAYDPVEDALHLFASNQDGTTFPAGTLNVNWVVDDVIYHAGYVWTSVRGSGIFRTKYSFRDLSRELAVYDTTAAGASVDALNGGWITSSDFDAGTPGLLKLWNTISIHADLPSTACSVFAEYSVDGGVTWADAGSVTKTGVATRYRTRLNIRTSDGDPVKAPRFKWRLTLRSTDTTKTPAVRAVHVQYLPIPDPGWQWQMTLVLSDRQELLDGTIQSMLEPGTSTLEDKIAALEAHYREHIPIYFKDIDGDEWVEDEGSEWPGVLITAFELRAVYIGPSSDGPKEYDLAITLLEAIEGYDAPEPEV